VALAAEVLSHLDAPVATVAGPTPARSAAWRRRIGGCRLAGRLRRQFGARKPPLAARTLNANARRHRRLGGAVVAPNCRPGQIISIASVSFCRKRGVWTCRPAGRIDTRALRRAPSPRAWCSTSWSR